MLEGKKVNLRPMGKQDIPQLKEWNNDLKFKGEYINPVQKPYERVELEWEREWNDISPFDMLTFIIEKKDGTPIGWAYYSYMIHPQGTGGYQLFVSSNITPSERGKGYRTEAIQVLVDYMFLQLNPRRIWAHAVVDDKAFQSDLENAGFMREATTRKSAFIRGKYVDRHVYGILREEWKKPKFLTKTTPF